MRSITIALDNVDNGLPERSYPDHIGDTANKVA
jgi:hypothetical protein